MEKRTPRKKERQDGVYCIFKLQNTKQLTISKEHSVPERSKCVNVFGCAKKLYKFCIKAIES